MYPFNFLLFDHVWRPLCVIYIYIYIYIVLNSCFWSRSVSFLGISDVLFVSTFHCVSNLIHFIKVGRIYCSTSLACSHILHSNTQHSPFRLHSTLHRQGRVGYVILISTFMSRPPDFQRIPQFVIFIFSSLCQSVLFCQLWPSLRGIEPNVLENNKRVRILVVLLCILLD